MTVKSASPPFTYQDDEVSITALQRPRHQSSLSISISISIYISPPNLPVGESPHSKALMANHTHNHIKTTSLIFPNHNISYHNILKFSIPSIMNFIKTNIHISHSHTHIYKHNTQIVPIVRLYSPRAQKKYTKA